MTDVTCGNCGRTYSWPDNNLPHINCSCGAKVFKPKPPKAEPLKVFNSSKEEIPPIPPKEEKKKRLLNRLKKKSSKEKDVGDILDKPPEPPKEKTLFEKLISIPGIAEKVANEICEEYKNIEEIKAAIRDKSFSVGGVGFLKKRLMLKLLK